MSAKLPKEMNKFTEYEATIRHKEIDLIQSIITRLADNQMKVKTLCITILGFLTWIFKAGNIASVSLNSLLLASILTIIAGYGLDFSFLKKERLYRMWFEFLQDKRSETKAWLFEVNLKNIIHILKDRRCIFDQYNPDLINKTLYKNWSLKFYAFLFVIICIIYLPACLAALSTQ